MNNNKYDLSKCQTIWLVVLEDDDWLAFSLRGIVKVMNPNWSSFGYLMDSEGIFKGFFTQSRIKPDVLAIVDFANIWGLDSNWSWINIRFVYKSCTMVRDFIIGDVLSFSSTIYRI